MYTFKSTKKKKKKKGIVDLVFCFGAGKTEAQETVAQAHACN